MPPSGISIWGPTIAPFYGSLICGLTRHHRKGTKTMSLLPDTRYSLLARLADPADASAWSEFIEIYETAIYRYARSHAIQDADAREVVQQVLIAVHQAIGNWYP